MNESTSPPPNTAEQLETFPKQRTPFWGWQDVLLFFGLGLPAILLAQLLAVLIAKMLRLSPKDSIVLVSGQAFGYLLLFVILAGILRLQYDAPFWKSLGWESSRIPGAMAILGGAALAIGLAIVGGLLHVSNADSPVNRLLESPHGAIVLAVFGTTVAPLAEELAFRGFLQPLLVRVLGATGGILITAFLFGVLHFEQNAKSWAHVALIAAAGAGFGILRQVSGSIRPAILAHVGYNSALFITLFAFQERKISF